MSTSAQGNVSETIDFLGSEPGSILIRMEDQWLALAPGEPGDFLQMIDGTTALPGWGSGGGGGGDSRLIPLPGPGILRTIGGDSWTPVSSLFLTHAWAEGPKLVSSIQCPIISSGIATIYKPVIYDWGDSVQIPASTAGAALVATGPDQQISVRGILDLPLDNPTLLPGDRLYLIGMHKRASTANSTPQAMSYNRQTWFNSVATAVPPPTLPALTSGFANSMSIWTEEV